MTGALTPSIADVGVETSISSVIGEKAADLIAHPVSLVIPPVEPPPAEPPLVEPVEPPLVE